MLGFATALATVGAVALPASANASAFGSCSIDPVPAPYNHVDIISRYWVYGHATGSCNGVMSGALHSRIARWNGTTWVAANYFTDGIVGVPANGNSTPTLAYAEGCRSHRTAYFAQYAWLNYTTLTGQHVTIDRSSRFVAIEGC